MSRPIPLDRDAIARRLAGARAALFLDYDGTLTPIVDRPGDAVLAPGSRALLRHLAARMPVVVVSGREREDVARRVGLDDLTYAGSHGFDIAGPRGSDLRHEVGREHRTAVSRIARELSGEVGRIDGVLVEDKRYSVAVHYRLAPGDRVADIESAVERSLRSHPDFRRSDGKKVIEVRPRLDWDKGRAAIWLLGAFDPDREGMVPIYIGDDTTDEDAFRALLGRGITVLVAAAPRPTAAEYSLRDPDEVAGFLRFLASLA